MSGGMRQIAAAPEFPIASDVRLAGDSKQTRFVLDLDKSIPFRAFALADPRIMARITQLGDTVLPLSPGRYAELVADETDKWAKVIRAANIRAE